MLRPSIRVILLALALLILFAELAPGAGGSERPAVRLHVHVDRVEDEWVVLDIPPQPSLPIPRGMADWAREGEPVVVTVTRATRTRNPRGDEEPSSWRAEILELGERLLLRTGDADFHWPANLAPRVRRSDVLEFRVEPESAAAADGA